MTLSGRGKQVRVCARQEHGWIYRACQVLFWYQSMAGPVRSDVFFVVNMIRLVLGSRGWMILVSSHLVFFLFFLTLSVGLFL